MQSTSAPMHDEMQAELARDQARQAEDRAEQAVIDAAVEMASTPSSGNLLALRQAVADLDRANDAAIRASEAARAAYEGRRIF